MGKLRLDQMLANRGAVSSRSQAESYIKLGYVTVDGAVVTKPGKEVSEKSAVKLTAPKKYVSRAGLKLASVVKPLELVFNDKAVLDVGSSTGGFTDYALQHGAVRVIAVDSGSNQLHDNLRNDSRIELHEQTDIRLLKSLSTKVDIVLIDVSFISLREILPHVGKLISPEALVVAMVKPQFEVQDSRYKHKGVIKNDSMRRKILKDFEQWASGQYKIVAKSDSSVTGEKGNRERFYSLRLKP